MGDLLFYHHNCKASNKLLSMIPNDFKIQKINIDELRTIPSQITQVPMAQINNSLICGKELFMYFENLKNNIISIDIKKSNKLTGILGSDKNIQLNSHFGLSEQTDGFVGVPTFNESEVKSVEQLKRERN